MAAYVALLRAVNVGGHGKVSMADLRRCFENLGFTRVRTLLQSGNVVFESEPADGSTLEARLEAGAARRLGLASDFLVRDAAQWADLVARSPFPDMAVDDPGRLLVYPLKSAPDPAAGEALRAAIVGRESIHLEDRELYAAYPDGIGNSKLTITLIERKLGARGTGRNWNTALKIAAALRA